MWALAIPIVLLILGRFLDKREITAVGWVAFAGYWLSKLPYYAFEVQSFVETGLVAVGIPLCVYIAYLSYNEHQTIETLTEITAVAGSIAMVATIPTVEKLLIENVARQTAFIIEMVGQQTQLVQGADGYQQELVLVGSPYKTYITLGCTGVGSMAVFTGLFAAVDGDLKTRVLGWMSVISAIHILNLGRNVFVSLAYGKQWFPFDGIAPALGYTQHEAMVSFYLAHTVISQVLAVFALLGLLVMSMRLVPETRDLLKDVLDLVPTLQK